MKMKTTWRKCVRFASVIQGVPERGIPGYLAREEQKAKDAGSPRLADTKLKYAINRVLPQFNELQPKMDLLFADAAMEFASEHEEGKEKGTLMRDPQGGYLYSKKKAQELAKKNAEILDAENIEIEPYYATKIPDDLDISILEVFRGFVISDKDADEFLRAAEERAGQVEVAAIQEPVEKASQENGLDSGVNP